jgi:hypothetical protein
MTDYPKPPFPKQAQAVPGSQSNMQPYPDCGEQTYVGSGRLAGKIALITGADSGIGRRWRLPSPVKAPTWSWPI